MCSYCKGCGLIIRTYNGRSMDDISVVVILESHTAVQLYPSEVRVEGQEEENKTQSQEPLRPCADDMESVALCVCEVYRVQVSGCMREGTMNEWV